jgi:uncharacterized repeat protein (TIGR03803 family)
MLEETIMRPSVFRRSFLLTLIALSLVGWGTNFGSAAAVARDSRSRSSRLAVPNTPQETVLYRFTGPPDGEFPGAGLLVDGAGRFFGTTEAGGKSGSGTVFRLTPSGGGYKESIIHSFKGGSADGARPESDLIADSHGVFYGTTFLGGTTSVGIVFKLTPSGRGGYTESVLYSFKGGADGSNPFAGLLADSTGALYGTTTSGGASGHGTVFKLTSVGTGYTESVLYSFKGGIDGAKPFGGLIADSSGALYGTTAAGGSGGDLDTGEPVSAVCWPRVGGCGIVFKLTPSGNGYAESVLYRFVGGSDGWGPTGALIWGAMGALYGTTDYGGGGCTGPVGAGTAFKLAPSGNRYIETVISHFDCLNTGGTPFAGLIADSSGVLYGTTSQGRFSNCGPGCGAVFSLTPSGSGYNETTLYGFCGIECNDGAIPEGRLVIDASGALYGTTTYGGASSCQSYWGGCGTVFKLTR